MRLFMHIGIATLFSLTACAQSDWKCTGNCEENDTADTGDTAASTFGEPAAAWVQVELGYCSFKSSPDGGANWNTAQTVNVAESDDPVRLSGEVGELLQIFCDWSVVPRYDLPQITVDPSACPQVYCDGEGAEDRDSCEDPDDVWAYVYPQGSYNDGTTCGSSTIGY